MIRGGVGAWGRVIFTDLNDQTHPHTNAQLVSQSFDHTRFPSLTLTKLAYTQLGSHPSKIQYLTNCKSYTLSAYTHTTGGG